MRSAEEKRSPFWLERKKEEKKKRTLPVFHPIRLRRPFPRLRRHVHQDLRVRAVQLRGLRLGQSLVVALRGALPCEAARAVKGGRIVAMAFDEEGEVFADPMAGRLGRYDAAAAER